MNQYTEEVAQIISGNEQLASFWRKSAGWAPKESADLMSISRLDRQVELSKTLRLWESEGDGEGHLILAWANLGALIEGTLKLLLAVYFKDYKVDIGNFKTKQGVIKPDVLTLEKLCQFYAKKGLLSEDWLIYLKLVQYRRNSIHAFKDRPIGTFADFHISVSKYLKLLREISGKLPYPDDVCFPQF